MKNMKTMSVWETEILKLKSCEKHDWNKYKYPVKYNKFLTNKLLQTNNKS